MRERLVSRELNPLLYSLPPKFHTLHDWQQDAILDIVSAFVDDDMKVVVLEAPTGSGKTVIAEVVRRMLSTRGAYVCHNKDLQAQFAADFPYSSVLYGRSNYGHTTTGLSCEDCSWTKERPVCVVCEDRTTCPYQIAKHDAVHSPVPVLNSAYWLTETLNTRSRFANTGLCIFDEADTLEKILMDQVEVYLSERRQAEYRIEPPKKMTVASEYLPWTAHALDRLRPPLQRLSEIEFASVEQARELKRVVGLYSSISIMRDDLSQDQPWVYTGGAGSQKRRGEVIAFKPVKVDRFGAERIWKHDKRFLLMSATVVSPDQLLRDLGWTGSYRSVTIESQFHAKNRQVVVRPVADMSRRGFDERQRASLRDTVTATLGRHEGERGLVHTVSYALTDLLRDSCEAAKPGAVYSYTSARERSSSIAGFKASNAGVLVAPSADRGVDLPGDLCRFQIIAKVPFLSLGDKQISERLYNTPDGKVWYNVHVARTIMQMVGRGVRSQEDYCVCYVLDENFVKWYKAWGHLFPKWFRKAIRFE